MHACMYACVTLYSIYRPQLSSVQGYALSEVYCMYTCMYVCVTPHSPCRLQVSSLEEYISRGVFCFVCMVACMFVCRYERMYDRHTHIPIHTQVKGTHIHIKTHLHTLSFSARVYIHCMLNQSTMTCQTTDNASQTYLAPQVKVG